MLADLRRVTPYTVIAARAGCAPSLHAFASKASRRPVEEMSLGACSVAVPVRDGDDEVVAALGIVVASLKRDRDRLVASLQVAAHGVRRTLLSLSERTG